MQSAGGRALQPPLNPCEKFLRRPRAAQLRPRLMVDAKPLRLTWHWLILRKQHGKIGAQGAPLRHDRRIAEETKGERLDVANTGLILGEDPVALAFDDKDLRDRVAAEF